MHLVLYLLMRLMLSGRSGERSSLCYLESFNTQFFCLIWFRYESTSGGEREIQRTMLELLNQLDGFDTRGDVKVIMATNKIESLDPALIRPGRIDRKIEFPLPDVKTKRHIFRLHTSRMSLSGDVDLEEFIAAKDDLSGADIKAVCTEAGLLALRERRMRVTKADFASAREKVCWLLDTASVNWSSCTDFFRSCIERMKAHLKAYTCSSVLLSRTSYVCYLYLLMPNTQYTHSLIHCAFWVQTSGGCSEMISTSPKARGRTKRVISGGKL